MVDRKARTLFAEAIRALVSGQITNDQLEDIRLPALHTSDPAISAIYQEGVWRLYSDLHEHRLRGKYAVSRQDKSQVARWILFLRTDLPYTWPELHGVRFFALALANLLSLGLANRFYASWFKRQGDIDVWPFNSRDTFSAAREHAGYLGVTSNNSFKPNPLRGSA